MNDDIENNAPSPAVQMPGISEQRADGVAGILSDIRIGLDSLAAIGGWHDGDMVPAVTVRWFCGRLHDLAERGQDYLDTCQPEPATAS
jgi:hypothetical protein